MHRDSPLAAGDARQREEYFLIVPKFVIFQDCTGHWDRAVLVSSLFFFLDVISLMKI